MGVKAGCSTHVMSWVLSFQPQPSRVCVCVGVHLQTYMFLVFFFWASSDIFSRSRKGEGFGRAIIVVKKIATLGGGDLIFL